DAVQQRALSQDPPLALLAALGGPQRGQPRPEQSGDPARLCLDGVVVRRDEEQADRILLQRPASMKGDGDEPGRLKGRARRRLPVATEHTDTEADRRGGERIAVRLEIDGERRDPTRAYAERRDRSQHRHIVGITHEAKSARDGGRAAEPVEGALGAGREVVAAAQCLRQLEPIGRLDLRAAPRGGWQRGVGPHGLRSLRAAVVSRRVPAIWARSAAFSAMTASLPRPSTAGRDAGVTEPTASEYLRYVSIDATTTRASTVIRSMPTSETRTQASMTMPLSSTRSRTSMRLVPPLVRSTGIDQSPCRLTSRPPSRGVLPRRAVSDATLRSSSRTCRRNSSFSADRRFRFGARWASYFHQSRPICCALSMEHTIKRIRIVSNSTSASEILTSP